VTNKASVFFFLVYILSSYKLTSACTRTWCVPFSYNLPNSVLWSKHEKHWQWSIFLCFRPFL